MKVLFSNPPWWEAPEGNLMRKRWRAGVRAGSRWPFTYLARSKPDQYKFGDYLPYPFFMGYATTYARKMTGADVQFRDSIALRESYESYYRYLEEERYEYVFIESATPSCIINGESGVVDFDMLSRAEMNESPFPYFDATYAHRYWDANPKGQRAPHAQIWSSRGCPFKCIFCVWPAAMTGNDPDGTNARTVRHYTPAYMEAFVRELLERFQFKCIYFDDDTFNLGNKHTVQMCEVMSRIGVPWSAMCRADSIKMETWQLMKESGCFGVKLGFESGNQYVVDKIVNKHLDLNYSREVVHELKRIGMTVHGTFTYGLPGETKEQMLDTKQFIASLPFDSIQESGTAEIEGTPLHTLRERGKLEQYEGAHIDLHYQREVDGNKKWQRMVEELKSN